MTDKLEVLNPATGDVVGVYPVADRDDVDAAVKDDATFATLLTVLHGRANQLPTRR